MANTHGDAYDSHNDLSWLTQEPSQKPKKVKIRKATEIQHLSENVQSNFEDFVFNIGLDTQNSDTQSDYDITEFPSPGPILEDSTVASSKLSNVHNSQVGF